MIHLFLTLLISLGHQQVEPKTDEAIIQGYIDQLNWELSELNKEELLESYTLEEALHIRDSTLEDYRASFSSGEVFQSPDSAFKVYIIEGEFCGAYCNPQWESYIHIANRPDTAINLTIYPINQIHKLDESSYLILSHSHARPAGYYTVECVHATILTMNESGLINKIDYSDKEFLSYCTPHLIPDSPSVNWDPKENRLEYHSADDPYMGGDTATFEDGYYQIIDHQFQFGAAKTWKEVIEEF